jgi:N-acetylglutamate synthase-like GNAT family acetyltransferase
MEYIETVASNIPISLLLEADPSEQKIHHYLSSSWCYVAVTNEHIIGACLIRPDSALNLAEIVNVSIVPELQKQGIGSELLKFSLAQLKQKGIKRVQLSTGTFGHQLTYYQRIGFRVESVVKNYFLTQYSEPIYEHGIQHKDMLKLYMTL